jgi:ATP-dependent Clp protease ATP-binding subunit ClpA
MNVKIFYGGLSGFRKILPNEDYISIVDLALMYDSARRKVKFEMQGQEIKEDEIEEKLHYDNVVAFSDDYPSLSESSIESFTNLILRFDIDNLYFQNPPDSIVKHIQELSFVDCQTISHEYKIIDMDLLKEIKRGFSDVVIGQENVKNKILATLYNVAKCRYNKPCVMLFYGSTGVGKTESAKFIADILDEILFRKQFSMLHSEEFSSYIFGGKHNQNSLAKELLERESNVILFDEFDKPHPVFHSAFYQLFDEGIYVDKNFTVKMKDSVIICTSNYMSEKEIKSALGEPIFSRFDAIIKFEKLNKDAICKIIEKEYERQYSILDDNEKNIIDRYNIKDKILGLSEILDNARQIRRIIREAFSDALIRELL